MATLRFPLGRATLAAFALTAIGSIVACAPYPNPPSPTQISAQSPSVTYSYRNDQELLMSRQNAEAYCAQFQAGPQQGMISSNPDGSKRVVFDCTRLPNVPVVGMIPSPATASVSYTYMSDSEFASAAANADAHCMRYGSRSVSSNIMTNPNGSRTATFQCGPR